LKILLWGKTWLPLYTLPIFFSFRGDQREKLKKINILGRDFEVFPLGPPYETMKIKVV
jgi:hypothetical protein